MVNLVTGTAKQLLINKNREIGIRVPDMLRVRKKADSWNILKAAPILICQ
jgi:hypothetical protein